MNSNQLREKHTNQSYIINEQSLLIENNIKQCSKKLFDELTISYPNNDIKLIYKFPLKLLSFLLDIDIHLSNENSFMKPDGGIILFNDIPILCTEAKKQGTNNNRLQEGLKKQAKGNAIERCGKNIEIFRYITYEHEYFPYLIFASGCDFENGSSIIDRILPFSSFRKPNEIYCFNQYKQFPKQPSVFINENSFTTDFIYSKMKEISIGMINIIKKEGKLWKKIKIT